MMNIDIADKIILITGGARGIGRHLAIALAKEGASVIINYKSSKNEAERLIETIEKFNHKCMIIQGDVSNKCDVKRIYDKINEKYQRIDLLINNAGISKDKLVVEMSEDEWKNVIDTNLTGCFFCSKEYAKLMMIKCKGKILNIASIRGQEGNAAQSNYSASKAGMIALTKSLAKELGENNILVNAVCPGFIQTDLNRHSLSKRINAQNRSAIKYDSALGDLTSFVILYASEFFCGVSGQVFVLDSRILNEKQKL